MLGPWQAHSCYSKQVLDWAGWLRKDPCCTHHVPKERTGKTAELHRTVISGLPLETTPRKQNSAQVAAADVAAAANVLHVPGDGCLGGHEPLFSPRTYLGRS